ncbi:MAG: thioesterase family protein [Candidatus Neomarinimicrobiota bacterium]|jgi:acyl-CoA thioester hydrolase
MKIWHSKLVVRSYELDSFAHVNNGTFAKYLEVARGDYMKEAGFDFDMLREWKTFPVIAKVCIEYKAPAFLFDILHIKAKVKKLGRSSIVLSYEIVREEGTLIATAETVMVFVDEKGKATEMHPSVREAFSQ